MARNASPDTDRDGRRSKPEREPVARVAGTGTASVTDEQFVDVWSRTDTRYRVRSVLLLVLNIVLFGGLGCFAYWIRTGVFFGPAEPNYWAILSETFHPSWSTSVHLGSLLTFPINVEEVPMQIVVLGLLLAALASVPIAVSILYRLPACIPFLLIVAFIATMPWLAITLAGSCILASAKPIRLPFRYASALLGLTLVVVYFVFASQSVSPAVETMSNPADRIKLIAPWILATVAGCTILAIVLLIAQMVNYRPGAIAPLLAIMFAVPVGLFEVYVGRDELHYRLLEKAYGPSSDYFADDDLTEEFESTVRKAWALRGSPPAARESVEATIEFQWLLALQQGSLLQKNTLLAEYVAKTVADADWFLKQFPESRYAANALYLKARALDMRVDENALRDEHRLRFFDSYPSAASTRSWELIVHNSKSHRLTAIALLRLAQTQSREGEIDRAVALLDRLFQESESAESKPGRQADALNSALKRKPVDATLAISLERTLLEARRLQNLLTENRDPLYGDEPLALFLRTVPHTLEYRANLERLLLRWPDAQIIDNVTLELAMATPDPHERIASLESAAAKYERGDALAEIYFRLAETYREVENIDKARSYYSRLIRSFPDSIWRRPAEERIAVLPAMIIEPGNEMKTK